MGYLVWLRRTMAKWMVNWVTNSILSSFLRNVNSPALHSFMNSLSNSDSSISDCWTFHTVGFFRSAIWNVTFLCWHLSLRSFLLCFAVSSDIIIRAGIIGNINRISILRILSFLVFPFSLEFLNLNRDNLNAGLEGSNQGMQLRR